MTQGPLPLILLAANEHPDPKFRAHLWSCLDAWLETRSPTMSHDDIDAILSKQKGTFLEPFRMERESRRTAVFLSRLTLAETAPGARVRIVSQDSIGNSGGLVVTKQSKSFYSERFELGRNRLVKSKIRFFAPSVGVKGPMKTTLGKGLYAVMYSDDNGMYIELSSDLLNLVNWDMDRRSLVSQLSSASEIGPKKQLISSMGVGVEVTDNGIRLAVKSPEALIRFSAYVVQAQSIRLVVNARFQLWVQLPSSAEGPAPITVTANDNFATEWMDVEGLGAPTLEAPDIKTIIDWSFNHISWLN